MVGHQWAELTSAELNSVDPEETVVVLPTGAVEQHGDHLPVGTDATIASAVADTAAERATDALVLPVLQYGYSPHHSGVPGTVSLSSETFLALLRDVLSSLVANGFERIVIVNGHGGNRSLLKTAVSDFRDSHDISVAVVSYWDMIREEIESGRESDQGGISHGGEMETSLLLYLREELVGERTADFVRDDRDGRRRIDLFGTGSVYYPEHFMELTERGVSGTPSAANPEFGKRLFEAAASELAAFLEEYKDW